MNSRSSQNGKKPQVVYHYPVSNKQASAKSKIGSNLKSDHVPGVGEVVIQDRFNPRPYFQYSEVSSGQYNSKPEQYPVYKPPEASKAPAVDLYTSPFNSYNPPVAKPTDDASQNLPVFPPNTAPQPPQDSYAANGDTKPSLGPPLAPSDTLSKSAPPNFPPKDEHDVYYPPDDSEDPKAQDDMGMDMPKQAATDDHQGPEQDQQVYYPNHPEVILDHPPAGYKPDMAEDDMQPPPADPHLKFPTYLYDHGYDHHHVYEEIAHTTTTPKPEKQRVSGAHYSYAHIGRKLWYIPLYFSVYFIIYVTVLIVKSIVRHKVEFKQHFERESRALNSEEELNRLQEDVSRRIESATHQYSNIM